MMNNQIFSEIINKLNKYNYAFTSGFAMEIYTNGKRKAGDLDVIISSEDIENFAKEINCKLQNRRIVKGPYKSEDYGGEVDYKGQMIEISSGYPKIRMIKNSIKKVFEKRIKKNYLNEEVYVTAIEELIVMKSAMQRPKDSPDLQLIKNSEYNLELIKEIAEDYGERDKILKFLSGAGYSI